MRKIELALVALCLFQTGGQLPQKTAQGTRTGNAKQRTAGSHNAPASQKNLKITDNSQQNSQSRPERDAQDSKTLNVAPIDVHPIDVRKDRADYVSIAAGLVLTIGTLVLAIIAWIQARAARVSADVAQVQAQALIGENRPWLLMELGELKPRIEDPFLEPVGTMAQGEERFSNCVFFVRNYGKTPGKVLKVQAELRTGESSSEAPSSEIEEIATRYNPGIFPQNASLAQVAELATGIVSLMELGDINASNRFLWLRGLIRYRHTVEAIGTQDYMTRFSYVWETRMNTPKPYWRLAGRSESNTAA